MTDTTDPLWTVEELSSRFDKLAAAYEELKHQSSERYASLLAVNDDLTARVQALAQANKELRLKLNGQLPRAPADCDSLSSQTAGPSGELSDQPLRAAALGQDSMPTSEQVSTLQVHDHNSVQQSRDNDVRHEQAVPTDQRLSSEQALIADFAPKAETKPKADVRSGSWADIVANEPASDDSGGSRSSEPGWITVRRGRKSPA